MCGRVSFIFLTFRVRPEFETGLLNQPSQNSRGRPRKTWGRISDWQPILPMGNYQPLGSRSIDIPLKLTSINSLRPTRKKRYSNYTVDTKYENCYYVFAKAGIRANYNLIKTVVAGSAGRDVMRKVRTGSLKVCPPSAELYLEKVSVRPLSNTKTGIVW